MGGHRDYELRVCALSRLCGGQDPGWQQKREGDHLRSAGNLCVVEIGLPSRESAVPGCVTLCVLTGQAGWRMLTVTKACLLLAWVGAASAFSPGVWHPGMRQAGVELRHRGSSGSTRPVSPLVRACAEESVGKAAVVVPNPAATSAAHLPPAQRKEKTAFLKRFVNDEDHSIIKSDGPPHRIALASLLISMTCLLPACSCRPGRPEQHDCAHGGSRGHILGGEDGDGSSPGRAELLKSGLFNDLLHDQFSA